MLKTCQTLRGLVTADYDSLTQEEVAIKLAIDELAGWCRQYSPLLGCGGAIGFKLGVSEDLASASEATLRDEDAQAVLSSLVRV